MTKYVIVKSVYFTLLWICISAADLKQREDVSKSTDVDFSFLESDAKHENWVDPFDMFEYKPSTDNLKMANIKDSEKIEDETKISKEDGSVEKKLQLQEDEGRKKETLQTDEKVNAKTNAEKIHKTCDRDQIETRGCKNNDFTHQQELFDANSKPDTNSCRDEEFIFLKRTANMIINKIKDLKQDSPSSALHIILTITEDAVSTLKSFLGSPCKHVQEFDSVIAVTLDNAELTNSYSYTESVFSYIHQFLQSEILIYCITTFIAVITLWSQLLRFSIRQIIPRLIIFIYFLSFAWNWVLLIKMETASAYAKAEKTSPSECHQDNMGVYKKISSILSSMFFSTDVCKQYYEAVFVEPIWKVSPLVVLSKTTSELIFHPLGLLGQHLGYFFQNLFSAVSWYLLVPVCVIVTISILLLLLMMFGYRVRVFPFLCLEPGQQYTREQNRLISDVLEGRLQVRRTDSIQNINVNERLAHCSNSTDLNNVGQNTIEQGGKKTSSNEDKGTQTSVTELSSLSTVCCDRLVNSKLNVTEPSSLSALCCDRLVNSKLNGKIQELEIVP